jgi:hypothetical protein
MLHYEPQHTRIFAEAIVSLGRNELEFWISDPTASRALESLLSSESTPNKSKKALIEQFLGSFTKLATDKYASHFVDKCWAACNLELKVSLEFLIPFLSSPRLLKNYLKIFQSFKVIFTGNSFFVTATLNCFEDDAMNGIIMKRE